MARIKFVQEDFAAFRPDERKPYQFKPGQIITPAEAIQTARQAVQLGSEVASAGVGVADYLTKAGIIGKEKTKEQLAEEVATKKAEELQKQREEQKTKLIQQQTAEEQRVQQAQAPLGAVGEQSTQFAINERKQFIDKINADLISLQHQENVLPSYYQSLTTNIDNAVKKGLITADEGKAITSKTNSLWIQAEAAQKQKAAELEPKLTPAKENLKQLEIQLRQDPENEQLQKQVEQARIETAALEKQLATQSQATREQFSAGLKQQLPAGMVNQIENLVAALPKERASTAYVELINKGAENLTTQEQVILNELVKKYPEFTQQAGQEPQAVKPPAPAEQAAPQPAPAPAPAAPAAPAIPPDARTTPMAQSRAPLQDWKVATESFVKGIDSRKAAIARDLRMTKEEKEAELGELDKLIETYDKYEAEVDKQSTAGRAYFNALNGLAKFFPAGTSVSKQDLLRARDNLSTLITALGDPQNLNNFADREDVRNSVLNSAVSSVFDALAEQQSLNQARVNQGGKLTPEQARRMVQLQDFITNTKGAVEEFKGVVQGRSAEENAKFKDFAIQLDKAVKNGTLPKPETEEQKNQRFQDALKMFDEETKRQITAAADQVKADYKAEHYDANELMLMAAQASLTNDLELTQKVLGIMKSGNVVGIPAQQFSDVLSGAHKNRYNQAVVETLFTRAKGKSDDELRIMLLNSLARQGEAAGKAEERQKRIEYLIQQTEEKKEQRQPKLEKLQAQAKILGEQSSPEALTALREGIINKATILANQALTSGDYYNKRNDLMDAQTYYYKHKIAGDIEKAKIGLRTEAIRNATTSGQSEIAADRNLAEQERRARQQQGLNDFDSFFDAKGKPIPADPADIDPITGKPVGNVAISKIDLFIPTKPRGTDKASQDAYNEFVKSQGAGNRDAGRAALTKRHQEAMLYSDRVANNKMDNGKNANFKYQYYQLLAQDKGDINRLNQLAHRASQGGDFEWLNFLDERREKLNDIRAKLNGLIGDKLTQKEIDTLNTERNKIRTEINAEAKKKFKFVKTDVLQPVAPTIAVPQ